MHRGRIVLVLAGLAIGLFVLLRVLTLEPSSGSNTVSAPASTGVAPEAGGIPPEMEDAIEARQRVEGATVAAESRGDSIADRVGDSAHSVRGEAVDDEGTPIAAGEVQASPVDEMLSEDEDPSAPVPQGRFVLSGLQAGAWDVRARADGHAPSSPERVVLPRDVGAVHLVLPRSASVSGKVVDSHGRPAVGARVRAVSQEGLLEFMGFEEPGAETDSEGRFLLEGVAPGVQGIRAAKSGFAESEPEEVDLRPGGTFQDLRLVLRRGGRFAGQVLDKASRPLADWNVLLYGSSSSIEKDAKSDAEGRFAFEDLPPGRYELSAFPTLKATPEEAAADEQEVMRMEMMATRTIAEIVEGETTRVVIGGPPEAAIRVHGRVLRGKGASLPFTDGHVSFQRAKDEARASPAAGVDDQGHYEVVVDGAGDYTVTFQGKLASIVFGDRITIPAGTAEFPHDIVPPSGEIRGRVILPDGAPGKQVVMLLEPDARSAELPANFTLGLQKSDDQGGFAFEGLQAGVYRLEVQQGPDPHPASRTAVRSGLVLAEGGRIDGLEIRLEAAARIEGIVTGPDGRPFPGASVFVRDERGFPLSRSWPPPASDASGRFAVDGLPPGVVVVGVWTKDLASVERPVITLRPGETSTVSLSLRPGTVLHVFTHDSDGKIVDASLSVTDERGNAVVGSLDPNPRASGETPQPESGIRLGPIPPGRYRITATNHAGTTVARDLDVSGDEMRVTLRFGG